MDNDESSNKRPYNIQTTETMGSDKLLENETKQEAPVPKHGLTVFTTTVFIVGELAGSGVLTLPSAVNDSGWVGFVLIGLCFLLSAYTGGVLGKSWTLVQERYPQFQGHVRYPYPAIGQVTYGTPGRLLVSFAINFTLFGVGVVFLIMASQNVQNLLRDVHVNMTFCYWLIIMAAILVPLCWFGTPADFQFVAVGAALTTSVACLLLFIQILLDRPLQQHVVHTPPSFTSFFFAFGTICFAFGGHPAFPTFQTDMKDHTQFGKAAFWAFFTVLVMYLPVTCAGYFVYGNKAAPNVLTTVSTGPLLYIVTVLITLHLVLGFIIVINPLCQESEELLNIPKEFNWRRCVSRTAIVGLVLFVAESVPHFGAILALVGGSTSTLLSYVLPLVFYMKLCDMQGEWDPVYVPLHIRVANYEIVAVGIVGGGAVTYSAIAGLASSATFSLPCYVNINEA